MEEDHCWVRYDVETAIEYARVIRVLLEIKTPVSFTYDCEEWSHYELDQFVSQHADCPGGMLAYRGHMTPERAAKESENVIKPSPLDEFLDMVRAREQERLKEKQ